MKIRIRYILLLLVISTGAISGSAINNQNNSELLKSLSVCEHDTLRLQILDQLVSINAQQPKIRRQYTDELLKEAELQNNSKYKCKAYLYHIFLDYNEQDLDRINQWMQKLEPLAKKEKLYDILLRGQQCVAEMLLFNEEYEQAEQYAKKMLKETKITNDIYSLIIANITLAGVYQSTYRISQAIEAMEAAFALTPQIENTHLHTALEIDTYLIALYRNTQNYHKWMQQLQIKEQRIQKIIKQIPQKEKTYRGDKLMIYLSYTRYYVEQNQPTLAAKYKKLSDQYFSDEYTVYKLHYYREIGNYYLFLKEWDKALEYVNTMLDILKISYKGYCSALPTKAIILHKMGHYQEALNTEKELFKAKDSLNVMIYNKQLEQLKSSYNTHQVLLKQSHIKSHYQLFALILVISLILILSYFAIRYSRIQKELGKSEKEIRKMAKEVEKATQVKEQFLANISYAVETPLSKVVERSLLLTSANEINDQERSRIVKDITETSHSLMKLVNEILDFSRLESGRMKFNITEIDVKAFIQDIIGTIPSGSINFTSDIPEEETVYTNIDGTCLSKVLNSLVVESTGKGELCVNLKKEPGYMLKISITNSILATSSPDQKIIIRNEINRMIINHFEGEYTIIPDSAIIFSIKYYSVNKNIELK